MFFGIIGYVFFETFKKRDDLTDAEGATMKDDGWGKN